MTGTERKRHTPERTRHASIDLRIDELVLHGFAPGERHAVGEAVERGLTRLLSERAASLPEQGWNVHHLDAGSVEVASAGSLGEGIARAVHASLTSPIVGAGRVGEVSCAGAGP